MDFQASCKHVFVCRDGLHIFLRARTEETIWPNTLNILLMRK